MKNGDLEIILGNIWLAAMWATDNTVAFVVCLLMAVIYFGVSIYKALRHD